MKAFNQLQKSIIVQSAAESSVISQFTERVRHMIAASALVTVAMMAANPAKADVFTPSACGAVGASIGAVAGSQAGGNSTVHAIGGAIGGLVGAATGAWLCDPSARTKDAARNRAEGYGVPDANAVGKHDGPRLALSLAESERLDALSVNAINAKVAWKLALKGYQDANRSGVSEGLKSAALVREAEARQRFDAERGVFAKTVAQLHNGTDGKPPRAVGQYLEVSASLLELSTSAKVSYDMLERKDQELLNRSETYMSEAVRARDLRTSNRPT